MCATFYIEWFWAQGWTKFLLSRCRHSTKKFLPTWPFQLAPGKTGSWRWLGVAPVARHRAAIATGATTGPTRPSRCRGWSGATRWGEGSSLSYWWYLGAVLIGVVLRRGCLSYIFLPLEVLLKLPMSLFLSKWKVIIFQIHYILWKLNWGLALGIIMSRFAVQNFYGRQYWSHWPGPWFFGVGEWYNSKQFNHPKSPLSNWRYSQVQFKDISIKIPHQKYPKNASTVPLPWHLLVLLYPTQAFILSCLWIEGKLLGPKRSSDFRFLQDESEAEK